MDKIEIIVIATAVVILGFRLYQKYIKKEKENFVAGKKSPSSSIMTSTSKDDDYIPYSKK